MTLRRIARGLAFALLAATLAAQAASGPKPASPEEAAALKSLMVTFNDPATSVNLLDQAISGFRQQYPQSAYTVAILVDAVKFSKAHGAYLEMLDYGSQVLQRAPRNLYTLSTLGAAIPDNVKSSDLDRDQRLQQAAGYDRDVIEIASSLVITGPSVEFEGNHFTDQQAARLKDDLEAPAYVSLGRIASLQGNYSDAATNFSKALPFERTPDAQAQIEFDLGQAEAAQGDASGAQAAFAKALQLAPNSPMLDRMVQLEQAKLKKGPGN